MNQDQQSQQIRQSNLALYAVTTATVVGCGAVGAVAFLAYEVWNSTPEPARLVLMGTCSLVPVIGVTAVLMIGANHLMRGLGERVAQRPQIYTNEIEANYREIQPRQFQLPSHQPQQAQNIRVAPINYPRRKQLPQLPKTITTKDVTVSVEKLRKMLQATAPTREAVEEAKAGIDHNHFAGYKKFLGYHHMIKEGRVAAWPDDVSDAIAREQWLDELLVPPPTATEEFTE